MLCCKPQMHSLTSFIIGTGPDPSMAANHLLVNEDTEPNIVNFNETKPGR